jgi:DHA1 family tetracycline resistance protein-like MFS transporter
MGHSGGFDWSIRLPFIVAGCFSIINVIYGFLVLPESLEHTQRRDLDLARVIPGSSIRNLKKYPVVAGLAVTFFLLNLASHAVQSNWNYFTKYQFDWSNVTVGISLTVVGVLVALVQGLLIRKTIPLLGEKRSSFIGMGFFAAGMLLFAFATQGWMMFVFLVPYCLGGLGGPAIQGIMSSYVPANAQGELQGTLSSLQSITMFTGPLIMNNLFAWFTGNGAPFVFPGMPFVVGAAMIVVAMLFAIKPLRNHMTQKAVEKEQTA